VNPRSIELPSIGKYYFRPLPQFVCLLSFRSGVPINIVIGAVKIIRATGVQAMLKYFLKDLVYLL